ncbi:type II toxin-antitoxin system HicB family antitoxin [Moraxella catarrhalis]|nr:type II toxin-antitoxin system HicB family antitoxin [Moraxella catarrhalis]MPW67837.1 type II toxin-antitoxin system HicB family antitoxin [Moraxella catarrhalis]MPX56437.1 type II toxin-antitoxin system HicB family antitoxin [Moraxella catarrhalis]RKL80847.1 type II toxin-antitoxin system HicB family antitoxin [Moraxella catarrhalis]RKL91152.1 type II toxin-antitoxin system HicB family antitoxin [Moraxella catarrhalis]
MLYPIAILKGGDKTAHGIFFPDVPNLASACDELQDIHKMALECLDVHFSGLVADGEEIPLPTNFDAHTQNSQFDGMMWAWVDVDLSKYDVKSHKINITLPNHLIAKIDEKVSAHKSLYKSRSNYLAQLAMADLA